MEERTADLAASRQALERNEEQLHTLTGRILTAQEEERRRIAQDLHDDVNQRLALLMLDCKASTAGLTRCRPKFRRPSAMW